MLLGSSDLWLGSTLPLSCSSTLYRPGRKTQRLTAQALHWPGCLPAAGDPLSPGRVGTGGGGSGVVCQNERGRSCLLETNFTNDFCNN